MSNRTRSRWQQTIPGTATPVNPEPIVYALIENRTKGYLLHQLAEQNYPRCSVYFFGHWGELIAALGTAPDKELPALIALDLQSGRYDNFSMLSCLQNSRRFQTIPTLLLASGLEASAWLCS